MALMAGDHSDNEDWRRQRAEQLRLHDAGPFATRPARERQPIVDSVEPMLQPVAPVPPSAPVPELTPSRGEQRRGSEPAARRHRPQSRLVSGAADAPVATAVPLAPRRPRGSAFAARHPLVLGACGIAALAGAGALGWIIRAEIEPVRTAVVIQTAPVAVVPGVPQAAATLVIVRKPIAEPVAPTPPVTQSGPPRELAADPKPSRAVAAQAASTVPQLPEARTPEARVGDTRPVLAATAPASKPEPDPSSRFAYPAKAVALPGRDFRPSFDCSRAMTATNRAVCASPELSALDRQMSQAFYRVTAHTELERHKAIDRDQVDFLNQRASCSSDECIAKVYRQRLNELYHAASREAAYNRVGDPATPDN